MRNRVLTAVLALVAGGLLWFVVTPGLHWSGGQTSLAKWDGPLVVLRAGKPVPAARMMPLYPGDLVRTSAEGSARIACQGEATWIDLANETELAVVRAGRGKELMLLRGNLEAQVAPQKEPMICRTPWGAATVMGTKFHLSADQQSRLDVVEGKVRLEANGAENTVEVTTGEYAELSGDTEVTVANLWKGVRYEAETLSVSDGDASRAPVFTQKMASGGRVRRLVPRHPGDSFTFHLPVEQAGTYLVKLGLLRWRMSGILELKVDGVPVGGTRDSYGGGPFPLGLTLGVVTFGNAGVKDLEIRVLGRNPSATAGQVLLDYLELIPQAGTLRTNWTGEKDTLTTAAGADLHVPAPGVLANDGVARGVQAVLVSDPSHGTLRLRPDGGLDYQPDAGFAGVDHFAYELRDQDGYSPPVEGTITVRPVRSHLDVAYTAAPPVIDGQVDSRWLAAPRHPLKHLILGTAQADFSAAFRTLYDSDNLYVLVEVADSTPVRNFPGRTQDSDAIEIYLDANNDKLTSYGVDDTAWRFVRGATNAEIFAGNAKSAALTAFACVERGSGYVLAARFSWAALGQRNVAPDALLGLDVHVMDNRNGKTRDALLAWFNTQSLAYHNPATFGTARLAEPGNTALAASARPDSARRGKSNGQAITSVVTVQTNHQP